MDHYIVENGPFIVACEKLLTKDFRLSWLDRLLAIDPDAPPKKQDAHEKTSPDVSDDIDVDDAVEKYSLDDLDTVVCDQLT